MGSESVEVVEKVDARGLSNRIEQKSEFGGGFAHELRYSSFQLDGDKRSVQFSGERGDRHRFAGAGRADKQKFATGAWRKPHPEDHR